MYLYLHSCIRTQVDMYVQHTLSFPPEAVINSPFRPTCNPTGDAHPTYTLGHLLYKTITHWVVALINIPLD